MYEIVCNKRIFPDKKAGVPLFPVSKEENDAFYEVLLRYAIEEYIDNAKARGVESEASIILKYWNKMKWGGGGIE